MTLPPGLLVALAMGGGFAAVMLLLLLFLRAGDLHEKISGRARWPALAGLFIAGLVLTVLTPLFGAEYPVWLNLSLGATILNLSDIPARLWLRLAFWLNGAALLAVTGLAWMKREYFVAEGTLGLLLDVLPPLLVATYVIAHLYRLLRPSPPAAPSEPGIPA